MTLQNLFKMANRILICRNLGCGQSLREHNNFIKRLTRGIAEHCLCYDVESSERIRQEVEVDGVASFIDSRTKREPVIHPGMDLNGNTIFSEHKEGAKS